MKLGLRLWLRLWLWLTWDVDMKFELWPRVGVEPGSEHEPRVSVRGAPLYS